MFPIEIISLRDTDRDLEGTVYLSTVNGDYYPVCDQQWSSDAAQVVCKELGYPSARRATLQSFFAREAQSPITGFNRLDCVGSESSVLGCSNANSLSVEVDSCQGLAGVICGSKHLLNMFCVLYCNCVCVFMCVLVFCGVCVCAVEHAHVCLFVF